MPKVLGIEPSPLWSIAVNRHERRASVKSIRHSDLITHLIPASVPLDDHAVLHNAVLHWYGNIDVRKADLHRNRRCGGFDAKLAEVCWRNCRRSRSSASSPRRMSRTGSEPLSVF
jgi:hypothetical protein